MKVQLGDETEQRVLGMLVHERNQRVVGRVAAALTDGLETGMATLVVPTDVAIEVALFDALPEPDRWWDLQCDEGRVHLGWGLWTEGAEGEHHDLPEGLALDASTKASARMASRILLLRTEKPTDGYISRRFNRPMSRFFSGLFLRARMTAGFASAVSLAIGLGAGWILAQPGWLAVVVGGVLFQAASMFDGVDGEIARGTLSESAMGARIDTTVDNGTYLVCLLGFGVGWMREGVSHLELGLIGAAVVGGVIAFLQVSAFIRAYAPTASFVFLDSCVHAAARERAPLSLRVASLLFHALRRDLAAFLLMFVAFAGSRGTIVGLVLFGIAIANLTLIVHRKRLVAAAHAFNASR
jgi:phosphatidylglycerophosphate synthase